MRKMYFVFALAGLCAGETPTSWTPEFSLQFQTVGPVVPSHDGAWVAWTQTRAVIETERSDEVTQIWIAKTDGSMRRQLTRGEKSSTNPAWSPDGKWIYFGSDRFGKNNLFRIPVDGGEAEQLTKTKGGVGVFALSKNGGTVAYTSAEPDPDIEKAIKEKRDFRVLDEKPKNAILYVIPTEGERQPRALTAADRHVMEIGWSPDSANIAFVYWATPVVNEWRKGKIAEADVAAGTLKEIATVSTFASAPVYSPDGRSIAFPQLSAKVPYPGASRIALYDRRSGSIRQIAATPNEGSRLIGWNADSRGVFVSDARRTATAIYQLPIDGPAAEFYAPKAVIGAVHMDDSGRVLGLSSEANDSAPEAYVLAVGGKSPVRVSAANTELPKLPLGKTEAIRWPSKDGTEIEGLLTYPVGYQPGKKVPLVLNIHGGPAGAFSEQFIGRAGLYPIAVFAAKGYAVLRPNPRGSSGYGKDFRYSNVRDWGGKDYEDDQSGVDYLIAKGIVDPDRMAVMGWSYGGYMTSWTIGHTTRFKAAAVGAGVTNLVSFAGTTDIADFLPDYFTGEFWQQADLYREHSPITYAGKVTTPTLVLHGDADERVPPTQGIEYYTALKRRGIPTKMVMYPRQPHGPHEPKFVLDIMQRHVAWLDQYIH